MLVNPVTLLTPIAATAGNAFTPLVSIDNIGTLYDRAGGTLTSGKTSTDTFVDYEGNVVDTLPGEIVYDGGRRVDHGDAAIYNAGVAGIEYFDTEADGITPITPAPKMRHQGAATNLFTYSQDFTQTEWAKTRVTLTANNELAPDGTMSASTLTQNAAGTGAQHGQTINVTSGSKYTVTRYLKAGTTNWAVFWLYSWNTNNGARQWFNLATGDLGSSATFGAGIPAEGAKITPTANGFYKCQLTVTSDDTSFWVGVYSTNADLAFAGDVGDSIIAWESQFEQGSYSTSIIPSGASAASRSADSIKLPLVVGTNFYQDRGVLLFRWVAGYDSDTTLNALLSINNGTGLLSDSATINTLTTTDGTNTANISNSFTVDDEILVAVVWIDSSLAINVSTDGGSTWATWAATTYDGAFDVSSYINWFYNNPYINYVKSTKLYHPPNITLAQIQNWVEQNAGSLT